MDTDKLLNINNIGRLVIISNLYIEAYSLILADNYVDLTLLNRIYLEI